MIALSPEHPKRDQNPKFTPLKQDNEHPSLSYANSSPGSNYGHHGHLIFILKQFILVSNKIQFRKLKTVFPFIDIYWKAQQGDCQYQIPLKSYNNVLSEDNVHM